MDDTQDDNLIIDRVCRKGDPRDTWGWQEGDPDYVAEFGLQQKHIPPLIKIARKWGEDEELPEDEWTWPIHAWRALAQLQAVEAVEPLLAMQNRLGEMHDDWYLEEFHDVFGLIGPPAIPALSAYLANRDNNEYARISAAHGLCQIGKRHPDARSQTAAVLSEQLGRHEPEAYDLNGFLVGYLTDLKAVESAEVIERAFAAGVVEESIPGDWGRIRQELGVAGLGLVPDRPRTPRPHFGFSGPPGESALVDQEHRDRQRQKDRQAKAKRKQQEKARKRNRKRR